MATDQGTPDLSRRHRIVAIACGTFVMLMVGAAYAAVPLYDLFCRMTGFAGRPVVATAAPSRTSDRQFEIRFDANVSPELPWRFIPEEPSVRIRAGEVRTVQYRIVNDSGRPTRGVASFNVTPEATAPFFAKIQCFCFAEQTLGPRETLELPVVFFVDPAIGGDKGLESITTITLSYTFFPAKEPATPVAEAPAPARAPNL
jgi:cytochrome c oxidase assembly protein subunit 11